MPATSAHIAVDLGAESGRVILGIIRDERVQMQVCHRFGHGALQVDGELHWDLDTLWREVRAGLGLAAKRAEEAGVAPSSVGVDSWGVDYAMLGPGGELVGPLRCYRDPIFTAEFNRIIELLGRKELYRRSGVQLQPFNTLYQYAARLRSAPLRYAQGCRLLFVPDLIHWLLTGQPSNERTNASTSQMMAAASLDVAAPDRWNEELLRELQLPSHPLGELSAPGTSLGTILPSIADETGLPPSVRVVLPPTHDTAAAVAAVPAAADSRWCFLSSGTWSLFGAELDAPCTTEEARRANFTNELGVSGTVRFLKNISGLWLVQQVRREHSLAGEEYDYEKLTRMAEASTPLRTLFPVDIPEITGANSISGAIRSFADRTGQPIPKSVGEVVRACLESLALQYAVTLAELEDILETTFDVIHVVGGGSQNSLLNQMTANATSRPVVAGPAEASALGNTLVQAMGTGTVRDLPHLRHVVSASEEPARFKANEDALWREARTRYLTLPKDVGCS